MKLLALKTAFQAVDVNVQIMSLQWTCTQCLHFHDAFQAKWPVTFLLEALQSTGTFNPYYCAGEGEPGESEKLW